MAREDGFFDELARGLADGTLTRGRALRLMGAALVGGTLASLGIREAGADAPGCKRAGKNCTRTDQCCGNLVCLSGTCQTPTTTTTETPTTTTTETPTTSTSTSTTSTSTTTPPPVQQIVCFCNNGNVFALDCMPVDCTTSQPVAACEPFCGGGGTVAATMCQDVC
jgi:hypothetical protein